MITNAQLAVGVAQLAADFKAGTITQAAHAAGLTALYDNWNQQISVGGLAKRVSEQITRFDSKFSSFLDLTVKGSKALVVDLPLTGVTGDLWWVLQAASGLPFGQAYIWIIDAWFPQGDRLTQGQTGAGVPPGGTTGQIATKGSSADYDIDWVDAGAGGTAIWGAITGTLASQTDLNTALNLKAPAASPTFTGVPAAPTAAGAANTTQLATCAFVIQQAYAPAAGPTFTGVPAAPTAAVNTSTTQLATCAFVINQAYSKLAGPTFTGVPAAPTAAVNTSSTQLATCAFVINQAYSKLAGPTFTGVPAAPTAAVNNNSTQLATTAYVDRAALTFFTVACSDETTALTTGVKTTWRMGAGFVLTGIKGSLTTAATSGTVTVDIKENGVSIFSTLLTFDATEDTTVTAAIAAVISDASLASDAKMTIDVTVAGVGAKGLKITFTGYNA